MIEIPKDVPVFNDPGRHPLDPGEPSTSATMPGSENARLDKLTRRNSAPVSGSTSGLISELASEAVATRAPGEDPAQLPASLRRTRSAPPSLDRHETASRPDPASTLETLETLERGPLEAPTAGPSPGVLASIAEGVRKAGAYAWKELDVRPMVSRANDAEFVARLRGTTEPGNGADPQPDLEAGAAPGVTLGTLRHDVADMRQRLAAAAVPGPDSQALPPAIVTHMSQRLDEIEALIKGLQKDEPAAKRAALYGAMNLLLPALPVAVALESGQKKFTAELAAMTAKTVLMAVGSMRSPTAASPDTLKDHFLARHYIGLIQAGSYAIPTFVKKLNHLNDDAKYALVAGVATSGIAFHAFFKDQVFDFANKKWRGSLNPDLTKAWNGLPPQSQAALQRAMEDLQGIAHTADRALIQAKDDFVAEGKELSPYTSGQVHRAADAFHRMARELASLLEAGGVDTTAGSTASSGGVALGGRHNDALVAKLALTLLATGICVGTTALMVPDTIAVVGNAGDGLFTAALMIKSTLDPNQGRQDALNEFRGFVGLSLIMLGVLSMNKGVSKALADGRKDFDFMDNGGPAAVGIAALGISLLNVTIPGPMGKVLAGGLEKLMNLKPTDLWDGLLALGDHALEAISRMNPDSLAPPAPSSVRIEELPDDPPVPGPQGPGPSHAAA